MTLPTVTRAYLSPINPSVYPHFAIILCSVGIFFLSWFFIYEVTTGAESGALKKKKNLSKELLLASFASVFLGFGTLFLLLWTGVYV